MINMSGQWDVVRLGAAVLAISFAVPAPAQVLSIDWYTIDGGGTGRANASTGGGFALSGSIGQPDADHLSGAGFDLAGGFWSAATPCLADWNRDGFINTSDFIAYLNDYVAGLNGQPFTFRDPDLAPPTGVINTSDFVAFLNLYNAGCP